MICAPAWTSPTSRLRRQNNRRTTGVGAWASNPVRGIRAFTTRSKTGLRATSKPAIAHLLHRIKSPEKLNAQLDSALYENFTHTGEFKREELDETVQRSCGRSQSELTGNTFDPRIADAMRDYINKGNNPESGRWEPGLVDRYGRVWKMDETGTTSHIISDLHGQVEHLSQIARRLTELQRR